jgi:hypothetical protein
MDTTQIRPRRAWLGRKTKIFLVLIILGLSLEGLARVQNYWRFGSLPTYLPRHFVDFYRFYRVNPAYRTASVRINSAGFRNDEEITREKPANVVRVVTVGGSTVWGEDPPDQSGLIDNRDTIAAHLEAALNARAKGRSSPIKVQVINAGVVGYQLFQEETYFSTYIAGFKPDVVVAIDGHNDLDNLQLGIPLYHHRNDALLDRELNRPTAFDVYRQVVRYGESKSVFIRKLSMQVSERLNRLALKAWHSRFEARPSDQAIGQWLDAYEATVRRFDASARIANASILFVVQLEVAGERLKPLTPEEVKLQETWGHYRWLHTVVRDQLIARLHQTREQHGVWFEDLTDAFRNEPGQAYVDYTHLSSLGARVMAERLATLVEPEVFCEERAVRSARCSASISVGSAGSVR